MPDSKDHSIRTVVREDVEDLFAELDDSTTTEMRIAVYGYLYGLFHAHVIDGDELNAYLARLDMRTADAAKLGVSL
jgi:hypothetical protein